MSSISRRRFLTGAGGLALGTLGLGSYAFAIEPGLMMDVTSYRVTPPNWPSNLPLRIAVIADIHACEPWMPAARIRRICETTNALNPDLIVILGDFHAGHNLVSAPVLPDQWGEAMSILKAPLGTFAILGNHDWWHGPLPKNPSDDAESIRVALKHAGIKLLENDAVRLTHNSQPFWLLGLADQMAHRISRGVFRGIHDLPGTLRKVSDQAPAILLAHEPFIFHNAPDRIALTLCGHTHGGQVQFPIIGSPFAARRFGKDYVYGHIVEDNRHMIISAGLGTSIVPVRFMRPPEIVVVEMGQPALV